MKSIHCFISLVIAMTLNACASSHAVIVQPLYQSPFCNNISRDLTLGGMALINREVLLAIVGQQQLKTLAHKPAAGQYMLLITQGLKSSAGYGVVLNSQQAVIEKTILKLPVSFQKPASNAITASVMTSPCLVLGVPKGRYMSIQAGDYFLPLP